LFSFRLLPCFTFWTSVLVHSPEVGRLVVSGLDSVDAATRRLEEWLLAAQLLRYRIDFV
jgi:hypothetical protein